MCTSTKILPAEYDSVASVLATVFICRDVSKLVVQHCLLLPCCAHCESHRTVETAIHTTLNARINHTQVIKNSRIAAENFSWGKFNMTLDCFCYQPIRTLVDSMSENPDVEPLGMVLMGVHFPTSSPKSAPSCVGIWTPSKT